MKLASYAIKGMSCGEVLTLLSGAVAVTRDFLHATLTGYSPLTLEIRFEYSGGSCGQARVKVSLKRSRMWGEVFSVCCEDHEESGSAVLSIRRVRGVGRVGADVVGHRVIEMLRTRAPGLEVLESAFF